MSTIFEKIIAGEVPSTKIYEDEKTFAFLDIEPVADGHTLLITKEPYRWIQDVPDDLLADLFIKAKELMRVIKKAMECDYVQLSVVGKDVPHVHIHLIPRYFDDDIPSAPTHEYKDDQPAQIAEKISENL